jgi:hypothetical protein
MSNTSQQQDHGHAERATSNLARQIEETAFCLSGYSHEMQNQIIADAMLQVAQKHNLAELPPSYIAYAARVFERVYEMEQEASPRC